MTTGDSTKVYRAVMNADALPGIARNFEVFKPFDFLAQVTQHIPDRSQYLVTENDSIRKILTHLGDNPHAAANDNAHRDCSLLYH